MASRQSCNASPVAPSPSVSAASMQPCKHPLIMARTGESFGAPAAARIRLSTFRAPLMAQPCVGRLAIVRATISGARVRFCQARFVSRHAVKPGRRGPRPARTTSTADLRAKRPPPHESGCPLPSCHPPHGRLQPRPRAPHVGRFAQPRGFGRMVAAPIAGAQVHPHARHAARNAARPLAGGRWRGPLMAQPRGRCAAGAAARAGSAVSGSPPCTMPWRTMRWKVVPSKRPSPVSRITNPMWLGARSGRRSTAASPRP